MCRVKVEYVGNEDEAESKEDYVKKVMETFKEDFNLDLDESEIYDIQEVADSDFHISTMEIPRPLNPDPKVKEKDIVTASGGCCNDEAGRS